MRLARTALVLALTCGPLGAQAPASDPNLPPGDLVVWFVDHPAAPPRPQPYTQYYETTAGSFGRPASSVGRAASDTGIASSDFPAAATKGSKPSSEIGQTAGSFGTASSNIGQTAGSYGQAASTLGTPAPAAGPPVFDAPTLAWVSTSSDQLGEIWPYTLAWLRQTFPKLRPRVAYVKFEDLQNRLAAMEGTRDYPDVLVGSPLLLPSEPAVLQTTLAHLGAPSFGAALENSHLPRPRDALILVHAQHPREARAFVVALSELGCSLCRGSAVPDNTRTPARIAAGAAESLLEGGQVGDADRAFAGPIQGSSAQALTFWPQSGKALESLSVKTDVLMAAANERFAAVALRCTAESAGGFGVVHPLVLLRASEDGHWRVLQISTDLETGLLARTFTALHPHAEHIGTDRLKPVMAVTQASPPDGDSRQLPLELWWDNPGSASMLVVEAQSRVAPDAWSDSHLQLVPDSGSRLQVRVTAAFPTFPGLYRWRVWSLGPGDVIALSPWRRLTVVP